VASAAPAAGATGWERYNASACVCRRGTNTLTRSDRFSRRISCVSRVAQYFSFSGRHCEQHPPVSSARKGAKRPRARRTFSANQAASCLASLDASLSSTPRRSARARSRTWRAATSASLADASFRLAERARDFRRTGDHSSSFFFVLLDGGACGRWAGAAGESLSSSVSADVSVSEEAQATVGRRAGDWRALEAGARSTRRSSHDSIDH
jgi:hypothetical protein